MKARSIVLLVGLAWSLFLWFTMASPGLASLAFTLAFTLVPFLALAGAARWLRPGVLIAAAVAVLAANVANLAAVRASHSSTAPVALLLGSLFMAVIVVPAALVASWLVSRLRPRS